MSSTFSVQCGSLPPPLLFLQDLEARLGWAAISCPDFFEVEGQLGNRSRSWHQDYLYHFYRPFVSSRGIEVKLDLEECHVSILPFSSMGDYELAFELLREFLQYGGGSVRSSDGLTAANGSELKEIFSRSWFDGFCYEALKEALAMLGDRPGTVLTLSGPVRKFYLGSRLVARLEQSLSLAPGAALMGGRELRDFARALEETMLDTQYALQNEAFAGYCESTIYQLRSQGASGLRAAYCPAEQGVLVPLVDCLAFDGEKRGKLYLLPKDAIGAMLLPLLLPSNEIHLLDEGQFLLAPLKDARYRQVLEALAPALHLT
ncbi:MAG: hypothetical protein K2Y32_12915 [Candidatus Obscuribacterales bacterium]|nr:hypothetical protein [Candidatus Obscuribacterales bacterium]